MGKNPNVVFMLTRICTIAPPLALPQNSLSWGCARLAAPDVLVISRTVPNTCRLYCICSILICEITSLFLLGIRCLYLIETSMPDAACLGLSVGRS